MVGTVTSHREGPGFSSRMGSAFLCGVCTFSLRQCRFSLGAAVHPTIIKNKYLVNFNCFSV